MDERATSASLFPGGGMAGALVRSIHWDETRLGPPHTWPLALIAQVRTMLAMRQPMCIFWGPGLVNLYNDGFLPILGEKHPTAMGQPAEECWREAWAIVGPQLLQAKQGTCVFNEEVLVPIARGGRVADAWWNYSYSPLFDDDGGAAGVLVICTEVTSEVLGRQRVEAASREAESAREQSDVLRAQAEKANRAKDEFLATVSHELRTPLNAILGWTLTLRGRQPPAEIDRALAIIERNARRQTRLIEDVLDVSRIISGKLLLTMGSTRIAEVVSAAIESVMPAAEAKGVTIDATADPDLTITADSDRLQQIAWNLLANAVKFSRKGSRVSIRAYRQGSEVCICVSDSGEGIPPDVIAHVFEPFRQAESSTTRKHGGLGLGLAIVKHLVTAHGGIVQASSDGPGHGATFVVSLPARAAVPAVIDAVEEVPSTASASRAASTSTDKSGVPRLDGLTVLVIDDEADARLVVEEVLREHGATVITAATATDALDVFTQTIPDVIVSDVGMPTMDGYELLRKLRALPVALGGRTPAVALTAFARKEDAQRAIAAGFQTHVPKPIDPIHLATIVGNLVGRTMS